MVSKRMLRVREGSKDCPVKDRNRFLASVFITNWVTKSERLRW